MRRKTDEEILEQLKTLYPTLSPEEILIAKENLERYLLLVWDVFEDCERESDHLLTGAPSGSNMQVKVDSQTN